MRGLWLSQIGQNKMQHSGYRLGGYPAVIPSLDALDFGVRDPIRHVEHDVVGQYGRLVAADLHDAAVLELFDQYAKRLSLSGQQAMKGMS